MKTHVYIDGQNFLYKAADILIEAGKIHDKNELTKIDIRGVIENIFEGDLCITFYGAKVKVRKDKGDDIHRKTTRFSDVSRRIRNTLNSQKISYNESGKLKLRDSDTCKNCGSQDLRMQEKGVDVGIAVDMVVGSLRDGVDKLILISSDTDLLPAIKIARENGSKVIYVGFSNKTTKAIVAEADETEIIRDQEIIQAYDELNNR
ncbi:NYN domain-containing protein [Candidatus Saccharibacteria bacterium]|nr:NYN domain-containing protein [Candidatus Saccharibacteria bacterium]